MAEILHLRCRSCGDPLRERHRPYCDACNLALAYRAMPFILGMLLLAPPLRAATARVAGPPAGRHLYGGYDDENALAWE